MMRMMLGRMLRRSRCTRPRRLWLRVVEAEQDSGAARANANSKARHSGFMMEEREDDAAVLRSFLWANLKGRKKEKKNQRVTTYVHLICKILRKIVVKANGTLAERNGISLKDWDWKKTTLNDCSRYVAKYLNTLTPDKSFNRGS